MKIITKRYPCTMEMEGTKKSLKIDFEKPKLIDNDTEMLVNLSEPTPDNIIKMSKEISDQNEKIKSLKLTFMKEGEEGTIDLLYVI